MSIPNQLNMTEGLSESFFDAFDYDRRDPRLDDFPFMSAMWPTVYMWLAYPILHVLPRTEEQCRRLWNVVTILKFFMASVIFALLFVNYFLRYEMILSDGNPRSPSYQVMVAWYLHYMTNLTYHQLDIFVYALMSSSRANHRSAIARGLFKSFNPLYMWMHSRYFPYGPDSYVVMASCLGHMFKEGANIMEMCRRKNCFLGRQIAATFQVFVYVCAEFYFVYMLFSVLFPCDGYMSPYPWQLIVIDVIFLFLLVVLFVRMYLDEFVLDKMN